MQSEKGYQLSSRERFRKGNDVANDEDDDDGGDDDDVTGVKREDRLSGVGGEEEGEGVGGGEDSSSLLLRLGTKWSLEEEDDGSGGDERKGREGEGW